MILHDPIPNLQGTTCTGLIRQEYWYKGQQFEQANVVYLQVNDNQWHRFLIDAGVLFWKVVDKPDEWETTQEDQHHYPQMELTEEYSLLGREIEAIILNDRGMISELQVRLSGGIALILQDEHDLNTFTIVSDAEPGAA